MKKFTKDGASSNEHKKARDDRMKALIETYPNVVQSYKIVHACHFDRFLKEDTSEFKTGFKNNDLYKNKYFFTRLIPRNACLTGKKELFHLSWMKEEHPNQTFHYWDLNSCFTHALKEFE